MREAGRRGDELGGVRGVEERDERTGFVTSSVEVQRSLAGSIGRGEREA